MQANIYWLSVGEDAAILLVAKDMSSRVLAQGESSRVNVHLSDSNVLEGSRKGKSSAWRDVAEQVRVLITTLQVKCGIVQHLLMSLTGLLNFQLRDSRSEQH